MASEEVLKEVSEAIDHSFVGCELLLTAFSASLGHLRKASVCTPFPRDLFPSSSSLENKDFAAASAVMEALPPLELLRRDVDLLRNLPTPAVSLLHWLLHSRMVSKQKTFRESSVQDLSQALQGQASAGSSLTSSPSYVVEVEAPAPPGWCSEGSLFAFHGTSLENLHSIIHNGLLNLSGTALQRTGAIHGDGIYCSTNFDVAFSFCVPGSTGPRPSSTMGRKLRVMLLCEVAAGGLPGVDSRLPDKYLVVKSAEHVRVRFILVYVDEAAAGRGKESSTSSGSGVQHVLTRLRDAVPVSGGALVVIFYAILLYFIGMAAKY